MTQQKDAKMKLILSFSALALMTPMMILSYFIHKKK
jgi:hypothetical protein